MLRTFAPAPTLAALLILTAAPAQAQIAAAVVAPGTDGAFHVDGQGNGVFAVVAVNLGPAPVPHSVGDELCSGYKVRAQGAAVALVCVLDQATGACEGPAVATLPVYLAQGAVGVYGVLVGGASADRIQVTFTEFHDPEPSLFRCAFPGNEASAGERGAVSIKVER